MLLTSMLAASVPVPPPISMMLRGELLSMLLSCLRSSNMKWPSARPYQGAKTSTGVNQSTCRTVAATRQRADQVCVVHAGVVVLRSAQSAASNRLCAAKLGWRGAPLQPHLQLLVGLCQLVSVLCLVQQPFKVDGLRQAPDGGAGPVEVPKLLHKQQQDVRVVLLPGCHNQVMDAPPQRHWNTHWVIEALVNEVPVQQRLREGPAEGRGSLCSCCS